MGDTAKTKPPTDEAQDVVLVHGRTEDGEGYRALRSRQGRVEQAELRPAEEGKPLTGSELVALHPRPQFPLLCDVEVLFKREQRGDGNGGSTGHEGPARVSSRSYRENWDEVFERGAKKSGGQAN